jgi:hypothetical protein
MATHRRPGSSFAHTGRARVLLGFAGLALVVAASTGWLLPTDSAGSSLTSGLPVSDTTSYADRPGGSSPPSDSSPADRSYRRGQAAGHWAKILRHLDGRREQAWADARPRGLTAVFARGSAVLQVDQATLQAYRRRGLRVSGVAMTFSRVHLVSRSGRLVRLRVVDRLGPAATLGDDGTARVLPTDRPSRHLIDLVHTSAGWRIADIVDSDGRPQR